MLKNSTLKKCKTSTKKTSAKRLPDLADFRKSIHIKGEPLSQTVIRGRG